MPHFIIEHANALADDRDFADAMQIAMDCGEGSGFIDKENIKVRLVPYTHILFGDGRTSFLHLTIYLLSGRTDAQKEALSISLRDALNDRFPKVESISIDVHDMNPVCYKKRLV
jgi:5-carboxymethyl-2-hydroxymuconate isomerase